MNNKSKTIRGKHSSLKLAYLAGFFDGEGTICITRWRNKRNKSNSWQHALYIRVVGTKSEIIEIFNHSFSPHRKVVIHKYRKDFLSYDWGCAGRNALKFLEIIYPYLKLKKLQAKLAIEFQKKKMNEKFDRRGIQLTSKDILWREEYRNKMQDFNKRNC
jgi:intein/homing endonuclease